MCSSLKDEGSRREEPDEGQRKAVCTLREGRVRRTHTEGGQEDLAQVGTMCASTCFSVLWGGHVLHGDVALLSFHSHLQRPRAGPCLRRGQSLNVLL